MRTIGVVTTSRADYGIYGSLLRAVHLAPDLDLTLYLTGMHLSPEFGLTARVVEDDGHPIAERIEMMLSSDTPEGIGKSMGLGVIGFAQTFHRQHPDILVVLGDRFEMFAAALAALPFKMALAHIHGGEVTQGAIDDALRHSLSKLCHLHFVSTEVYARRVIQLGEEPWRVTVSGAPALDSLRGFNPLSPAEMQARFGLSLDPERPPLLVTFHPVTLEFEQAGMQVQALLAALDQSGQPIVFTLPNADTSGRMIADLLRRFAERHSEAQIVDNLGTAGYFSMMHYAAAMVGNSSSGLIEAPSFDLPVVNIGIRQAGRVRGSNVIDVEPHKDAIHAGIQLALTPEFHAALKGQPNPYGDGQAAERVIERLRSVPIDDRLLVKRFYDL